MVMGAQQSFLDEEILAEYLLLTYLNKAEILNLCKLFYEVTNKYGKEYIPVQEVERIFPQLKHNPFKERIYRVFSSNGGETFSFEDILDLCSAMSEKCPDKVKASWAFRIFDFDEDDEIGAEDIKQAIESLTNSGGKLSEKEKDDIVSVLLKEMAMLSKGSVKQTEFVHSVGKMSDFPRSFCFRF